jgi:hypothetical protein
MAEFLIAAHAADPRCGSAMPRRLRFGGRCKSALQPRMARQSPSSGRTARTIGLRRRSGVGGLGWGGGNPAGCHRASCIRCSPSGRRDARPPADICGQRKSVADKSIGATISNKHQFDCFRRPGLISNPTVISSRPQSRAAVTLGRYTAPGFARIWTAAWVPRNSRWTNPSKFTRCRSLASRSR